MQSERDYSLTGHSAKHAEESGLAGVTWYQTDIPRDEFKMLMQRDDRAALRDTFLLFGIMGIALAGGVLLWGELMSIPFWLVYGVLYGSAMDSRWHECGHGTAFRTRHYNQWLYQIACFCMIRNPTVWRWSHARHHTDTIIVGRDPEIQAMRPPAIVTITLNFLGIPDAIRGWAMMLRNALGIIDSDDLTYIPTQEQAKVVRVARIWVLIYAITIALALWFSSLLPLMIIGLPRLYGAWHHVLTGLLQHAGLADNVSDHRLNSRTILLNPVSRFIYWNMNYHIEHHMFPMVPYHQLPRLHKMISHDLPPPTPSLWQGYREIIPILWRQRRDPEHHLRRELPQTANRYADHAG